MSLCRSLALRTTVTASRPISAPDKAANGKNLLGNLRERPLKEEARAEEVTYVRAEQCHAQIRESHQSRARFQNQADVGSDSSCAVAQSH